MSGALSAYKREQELNFIRCRGCRRRLALTTAPQMAFCNELCANDYPAGENEDRNALIWTINKCRGIRQTKLAESFGVARQWVNKVIKDWSTR
jgi:hypothetical protein